MTATEVLVVGAGMSGLRQAADLAAAGIDFLVLEKAADLGGTWRDNTYPDASCDVESDLYSYARDRNPRWSSTYATQPEILAYLRDVARRRGLRPSIRFGTEVTGARWQADSGTWVVSTSAGATYTSRFLVLGVGGLHTPKVPDLPGVFEGYAWHSSRWNHDVDLTGKRVALVGVGASGVQLVPHLAERAAALTVFQRTPAWVLPKADAPVSAWRKRLFRLLPWAQSLHRLRIYLRREKRGLGFHHRPDALAAAEPVVLRQIAAQVDDPELRDKLTPRYRLGCKRVLFSNEYYPALNRANVHVVAGGPTALRPRAVVDETGNEHEVDVVVYATGFDVTGSFHHIEVEGVDGRLLSDVWRTGASTYQGVAVSGFPNAFLLLGPHSAVPYTGAVVTIEAQSRYVVRAIRAVRAAGAVALVVRPEAERRFQEWLRRKFARTIWAVGGCRTWYHDDSPAGTVLYPGSTLAYRRLLRSVRLRDYELTTDPATAVHREPLREKR
ncbi:monooxygenase [Saccharothrix sp. NRRL B-16348]|uniref:flavin-containing monooxygenase n=1 Tax=Saccharothrix sp. NRRL B-16348 TaxID=1415542 RepID=UPI0006AF8799|nr:NAD(P)/FAD-dependent oxidoreductase [Saccharothrix sp. NRRL B-16348]KOX18406.1 monooxygenase [Saccharothrix sp. NRRL B-16348]